jgi:hypothetical protein
VGSWLLCCLPEEEEEVLTLIYIRRMAWVRRLVSHCVGMIQMAVALKKIMVENRALLNVQLLRAVILASLPTTVRRVMWRRRVMRS